MDRPDFSGLWQADLEKSCIAAPKPSKLLVKIAHGDKELKQAVLITRSTGEQNRQMFTYSMSGAESTTELRGTSLKMQVRWSGAEMIVESTYGGMEFRDHWSLSDDGRTLMMEHRDDAMTGQYTVFERVVGTTPPYEGS